MKISEITKDLRNDRDFRLVERLDRLIRVQPKYKTLNSENKEVILTLVRKYKERVRRGITITSKMIKEDRYYLYSNRFKLGLSSVDLEQIYSLLESFKE